MDGQGWVKIHRKIENWEWYKDPNTAHLFQHLVRRANHKDGKWRGITVPAGCLITSIRKLSEQTGLSERQVRTALNHLKSTHDVTQSSTNKYTLLKVNNYIKYQQDDTQSDKQPTQYRHTSDTQATTNKNNKNEENEKNEKNTVGAAPLPADEVVISLPLISGTYPIEKSQFDYWQDLYPSTDTLQEMKKMIGWLDSHPNKKRDQGNIKSFISRWLSKAQDQAMKELSSPKEETNTGLPDWYSYRPHSPQSETTKRELKKRMERIKNK